MCVCVCSLSVKLLVGRLRRGVCVCALCQLSSLWADFVGECVCVCSLSVKLLEGRFRRGVCVCVLSVS